HLLRRRGAAAPASPGHVAIPRGGPLRSHDGPRRPGGRSERDGSMAAVALRLLVVEDDDSIRTALRWALEDEGYDVAEAVSGEEAVRAVAVAAPDLMVVDLMLGSMDGYAVIREVRRDHDLPIIVVSARADTHDIVAALEAGADDYVTKP